VEVFICGDIHIDFELCCDSSQRATSDEMAKITKHYETSKGDEVKLLDKPEQ